MIRFKNVHFVPVSEGEVDKVRSGKMACTGNDGLGLEMGLRSLSVSNRALTYILECIAQQ